MRTQRQTLWPLALAAGPLDASALARAIDVQATEADPDFRTRLLIRDSLDALERHWGNTRLEAWLSGPGARGHARQFWRSDLGPVGFPSLGNRVMDATSPQSVLQFFRELGLRVREPARLDVGGSVSLILSGNLTRRTDDIDVVDEVPAVIRTRYDLVEEMRKTYGLHLAHFQSHYLPSGWRERVGYLDTFGQIDVYLVDAYDVAAGKLFSARRKDRDDLIVLSQRLDKDVLATRVRQSCGPLRGEARLAKLADENWYIVYGEPLPG